MIHRDRTASMKSRSYAALKTLFFICAVFLIGSNIWSHRFSMNPDGISYIDVGEYYLGLFAEHSRIWINTYWSPLYPVFLGVLFKVYRPSLQFEFPAVHILNGALALGNFISFSWLVDSVLRLIRDNAELQDSEIPFVERSILITSYLMFLGFTCLHLPPALVTPDILMSSFVYCATALLCRLQRAKTSWKVFVLFGAVLGFGYLAKAPLLIVNIAFLVTAAVSLKEGRKKIIIAALVFLACAFPLVARISFQVGHLSFGSSAESNYMVYVNKIPVSPSEDLLKDGSKILYFNADHHATLPFHYDPVLWQSHIPISFNWQKQASALKENSSIFYAVFLKRYGWPLILLWLIAIVKYRIGYFRRTLFLIPLSLPSIVGLVMFLMVLLEPRYVVSFVSILYLLTTAGLALMFAHQRRIFFKLMLGVLWFFMIASIVTVWVRDLKAVEWRPDENPVVTAEKVRSIGLKEGDEVAFIGQFYEAYWARLAKIKITGLITHPAQFWSDPEQGMAVLRKRQIRAIITDEAPKQPRAGWLPINGPYYLYWVDREKDKR